MLAKVYRFVCRKVQASRQQPKQADETQPKPDTAKPPAKKVLITYGIFSLLFIALASGAWFLKRAEWLPEYPLFQTNKSSIPAKADIRDDEKVAVQKKPQDTKPRVNTPSDSTSVDKLNKKVKQLKDEIRQLNSELDTIRVKQYLASARYLINTQTSPERALSILQTARAYIESHRNTLNLDTNALLQDIEQQIAQLQQYIAYSPKQTLTLLSPLIDHLHTELGADANSQKKDDPADDGWLAKIYAMGSNLIKIEQPNQRYIENNRLLLQLLIAARAAALLNEQAQFNIALEDALGLIDTMPQPPISREQIEYILSIEIIWQPPHSNDE